MKGIFKKILNKKGFKNNFIIVSGLPRSGTSMMMKMLEAGGIEVVTDNIRKADDDNPRGYYEFEKVKKIKENSSWLEDCRGKAFKMVSELLYHLPKDSDKKYKVIFMRREMSEMLASQKKMLERKGEKGAGISDEKMAELFKKHLQKIEKWLAEQKNFEVIYIKYNNVIKDSETNARVVNEFLGGWLNLEKMVSTVDKSLYRQRKI